MRVVLDSDFLVGLLVEDDANHEKSKAIAAWIFNDDNVWVCVLDGVIQETATVLSYKINHQAAVMFLDKVKKLPVIEVKLNDMIKERAWRIFKKSQKKKGVSFVDCANLAVVELYELEGVVSFDKFYPKDKRIQV